MANKRGKPQNFTVISKGRNKVLVNQPPQTKRQDIPVTPPARKPLPATRSR